MSNLARITCLGVFLFHYSFVAAGCVFTLGMRCFLQILASPASDSPSVGAADERRRQAAIGRGSVISPRGEPAPGHRWGCGGRSVGLAVAGRVGYFDARSSRARARAPEINHGATRTDTEGDWVSTE